MSTPYQNFGEPLPSGSIAQRENIKKRRWLARSDEEIVEQMDNRNLRYRKGWPQLPPLPVSTIRNGARDTVNDPQAVIDMVHLLCQAQRIHAIDIYFAFRVPEVKQAGEQYHTLVVATDLNEDPILYSLIIQIRKYLQQEPRHQEISIEIIDYRAVDGLFSFAIPPSEEHLLDIWQPVFDIVLEEIHKRKEQWITIEMLYRGLKNKAEACPATVVITSPSAAQDTWINSILPDIHKRVLVLSPSLTIELLCGSSLHMASQEVPADPQTYKDEVFMGSSIGQQDLQNHSGTAGGMVMLSNGATYALTNHHVVRNESLDNLLSNISNTSSEGLFLKPGNPAFNPDKHRITCPSNEDNAAFIQARERYKQELSLQIKNPDVSQYLASVGAELDVAKNKSRLFGTVYASSGLRTVKCEKFSSNPTDGKPAEETGKPQYRFMLDWCLLSFHKGRGMSNFLPLHWQNNNRNYSTVISGKHCGHWKVMNNPKHHISRHEVHVGKFGRTTGFTYGMINAVPTIINPVTDKGHFKFFSETYGFTVKDCGASMSVLPHSSAGTVVDKGDSGSIVIHAPSGVWLGLVFGATSSEAALFTPIDIVFRDIEKVTGHKVVEPVFNQNW